jgi:hypothetical protein
MRGFGIFAAFIALAHIPAPAAAQEKDKDGYIPLFDGKTLKGWSVSAETGHSRVSKNTSGGKWVVENGAIVGSQDVPGNGGIVITDQKFKNFEVEIEMNNDYGPDSGLFLRSNRKGQCYQAMIDYHAKGNLMGIYGEGIGGTPHVRNFNFLENVTDIEEVTGDKAGTPLPFKVSEWPNIWKHGQWNKLKARIENNPPKITTWINGIKIMEYQDTKIRLPDEGGIALQVHGGGDFTKQFVRYKGIRVKTLN